MPEAYQSLRSFRLMQLPCVSVLKGLKSEYSERPGEIVSRLKEEYDVYQLRKKEAKAQGKKAPLGEGALIFDEVKVRAKLQWNSSDNSLVGYGFNVRYIPLAWWRCLCSENRLHNANNVEGS